MIWYHYADESDMDRYSPVLVSILILSPCLYEQRYVYNCACLNSCRLGCSCSCITLEARLCLGDLQLYKQRRLYCKYIAVVEHTLTISFSFTNFSASPIVSLFSAI